MLENKRVLIFAGGGLSHVSGGVGTLLRYLIAEWDRDPASLPVRVVDTRGSGGPVSAAVHFCTALSALAWGRLTARAACAHIHMTTRGSALRKALLCTFARLLGIPVILHLHGADFFDFYATLPPPAARLLRAAIAGADCIAVIGTAWRTLLVQQLGVSPGRVRIIPNGVPAAPRSLPTGGPVRILFLGRLGARKGVPELVTALSSGQLAARSWTATIAGDGDAAPHIARIDAAGLADRIAMPGWLDAADTARALAAADMLVLPSHHEVMPVAILEAMARGLAIVATPVGAIPEILQDGGNALLVPPGGNALLVPPGGNALLVPPGGNALLVPPGGNALLVPPGDAAALACAIAALIDDPTLRRRLGDAAHRCFVERLDIAIPAASLQAIYRAAGSAHVPAASIHPVSA